MNRKEQVTDWHVRQVANGYIVCPMLQPGSLREPERTYVFLNEEAVAGFLAENAVAFD